jgi:hypothetical protein
VAEEQTFLSFRRPGERRPQPQHKPAALSTEEFLRLCEPEAEEEPKRQDHSPISPENLRKIAEAEERNRQAEAEYLKKLHPAGDR